METLYDFLNWAWERHHNPLSWYIRPLFVLPFCYFAYQRSWRGITVTLLALASSMFWFPKPAEVDPRAEAFLAMERQYLTGEWTFVKAALTALVPLFFVLLGWAFWRRSWLVGLLVLNLAVVGKVLWSFCFGAESAWSIVPAAALGLLVCNAVLLFAIRRFKRGQGSGPVSPGAIATVGTRAEAAAAADGGRDPGSS